jgi:hypothetical protein
MILAIVAACATQKPSADTATSRSGPTVDTTKPATAPKPLASDTTKPTSSAKTSSTKLKTKTSAKDTTRLGRDSVIRNNPRDPRYQIPAVPPKKPPQ